MKGIDFIGSIPTILYNINFIMKITYIRFDFIYDSKVNLAIRFNGGSLY